MLQTLFYISRDGQEVGPLSLEDIHNQLESQKLSETDYIYLEEKEDWVPLGDFLREQKDDKTPVAHLGVERRKHIPDTKDFINLLPDEPQSDSLQLSHPHETPSDTLAEEHLPSDPHDPEEPEPDELLISELEEEEPLLTGEFKAAESAEERSEDKTIDTQIVHHDFTLNKGVAEVQLEDLRPGRLELLVTLEGDQATHREEFKVHGGDPHQIRVTAPETWRATDDKVIVFDVLDEFDEPCSDYSGTLNLQIMGEPAMQVKLSGPRTEHKLECYKTGTHAIKFHSASPKLRHPESLSFEVLPGEPTSLKVHSEGTPRAGKPHKVKILAFDAYGNLATTFDGPLKIEVLEHPSNHRPKDVPSLKILPLGQKTG